MTQFEDAFNWMIAEHSRLAPIEIPVIDAIDRILAEDIIAPVNLPPFTQAKCDGFAINSQDSRNKKAVHEIIGSVKPGTFPRAVIQRGQAMEIDATAALPKGSDAVAPLDVVRVVMEGSRVGILKKVRRGENVTLAGDILPKGELLLRKGTLLNALEVGLLTFVGFASVKVFPAPKIGIISVGDELVEVGKRVAMGQLWDAVGLSMAALLYEFGIQSEYLGPVSQSEKTLSEKIKIAESYHFLLINGCTGDKRKRFILDVLKNFKVRWHISEIAMVPGGNVLIGKAGRTTIILLPANLFESIVFLETFFLPVVRLIMGFETRYQFQAEAILDSTMRKKGDFHLFQPAVVQFNKQTIVAKKYGSLGKGSMFDLSKCNGYISMPRQINRAKKGKSIDVIIRKIEF